MRSIALILAAGSACLCSPAAASEDARGLIGPPDFWLTILHNNDGESQLIDAGTGLEDFGGAARFATVVQNLRAVARTAPAGGSLLISAGDNFLAGPEFNASLSNGVPFFDTLALELIGYDAAAIGNHEFDFGPDVLTDFLSGFSAGPVFVSANLDFTNEPGVQALVNIGRVARSTVITVDGRQVGIVGATTPSLPFVSSPRNTIINDVAASVQAEIDLLTAQGVNIIILTSHLQNINEEIALATQLTGIDAIIAGGGDELLAGPGDLLIPGDTAAGAYPALSTSAGGVSVPVVVTPGDYKYVGRLALGFDAAGNLLEIGDESGVVRVAGGVQPDAVLPDPAVQAQVVDPVIDALAAQASNIVYTTQVGLDGQRQNIRRVETNLGNLIADAFLWVANDRAPAFGLAPVDVALSNGGGIRNDNIIPAGDVSELNNLGILPFSNFLSVVPSISAEQFKEILENAVSRIESTNGRYAQVAGFRMEIDLSRAAQTLDASANVVTPGSRVREVVLDNGTVIIEDGAVVAGAPTLNIAIADFLARGGDQYPFRGAPFTTLGITYDLALNEYVQHALGGVVTVLDYPGGGENRVIATGGPAAVGVCPADLNLNAGVNFFDVIDYLGLFEIGSPAADIDRNGLVNMMDLMAYINRFTTPCP
jgi:5'-nucleotidase